MLLRFLIPHIASLNDHFVVILSQITIYQNGVHQIKIQELYFVFYRVILGLNGLNYFFPLNSCFFDFYFESVEQSRPMRYEAFVYIMGVSK
ncbi:MAG: hypothetical protein ABF445_10210, partial [Leuconostoc mesenteroides]